MLVFAGWAKVGFSFLPGLGERVGLGMCSPSFGFGALAFWVLRIWDFEGTGELGIWAFVDFVEL